MEYFDIWLPKIFLIFDQNKRSDKKKNTKQKLARYVIPFLNYDLL